jgi:hypothetical protein
MSVTAIARDTTTAVNHVLVVEPLEVKHVIGPVHKEEAVIRL